MSAVGFPRVPKSWCSKWLPTLPLSSEVGTPSAGTSLSASPTASAAPASAVPSAQAAPPLTDVPWAPLVADGVLPSLHLAEGASGSTPAPLRSALPVPPPKQEAIPPPAPVPPTLAPLAKKQVFRKGRLKGPAALRNAEMERALRLQWSALSESERGPCSSRATTLRRTLASSDTACVKRATLAAPRLATPQASPPSLLGRTRLVSRVPADARHVLCRAHGAVMRSRRSELLQRAEQKKLH